MSSSVDDVNRLMSLDEFLNDQSEASEKTKDGTDHTIAKEVTHQGYLELKIKKSRWERLVDN